MAYGICYRHTGTIAVNQRREDVKIPVGILTVINVFACLNYVRKIAYCTYPSVVTATPENVTLF